MDLHTLTESSFATDDEARALLSAFHDGTLPRSAWNHRAHMTADAWGRATLPLDCWRRDTPFSRNARAGWIQPDLQALPVA